MNLTKEQRMTPRSNRVLKMADEIRVECGHEYLGTEHLLLALLRVENGAAKSALTKAGMTEAAFRNEVSPIPKTRPWNYPDDVPLNCWLSVGLDRSQFWLVEGVTQDGIYSAGGIKTWHDLGDGYTYSTDRKTWLPCIVAE